MLCCLCFVILWLYNVFLVSKFNSHSSHFKSPFSWTNLQCIISFFSETNSFPHSIHRKEISSPSPSILNLDFWNLCLTTGNNWNNNTDWLGFGDWLNWSYIYWVPKSALNIPFEKTLLIVSQVPQCWWNQSRADSVISGWSILASHTSHTGRPPNPHIPEEETKLWNTRNAGPWIYSSCIGLKAYGHSL